MSDRYERLERERQRSVDEMVKRLCTTDIQEVFDEMSADEPNDFVITFASMMDAFLEDGPWGHKGLELMIMVKNVSENIAEHRVDSIEAMMEYEE